MSDVSDRLSAALRGRYRVERQLGEGGMMATVYLADDLRHERKVAHLTYDRLKMRPEEYDWRGGGMIHPVRGVPMGDGRTLYISTEALQGFRRALNDLEAVAREHARLRK